MAVITIRLEDTDDDLINVSMETDQGTEEMTPAQVMAYQMLMLVGVEGEEDTADRRTAKETTKGN